MNQQDIISFDRAAHFYDDTRGFPPDVEPDIGQTIAKAGDLNADSQVLEVAIGTGRVALPLAKQIGVSVHGVDISTAMMKRIFEKKQSEVIYPVQANVYHLPYADATFDAVLAVHIFHLLPDFAPLNDEMRRVLKPDGIVLECWNSNDSALNKARRRMMGEVQGRPGNWERANTYLQNFGWQQRNHIIHEFSSQLAPHDVINSFKNRMWSSTWHMTDAEIAQRVEALEREFTETYNDLSQPVTLHHQFHASAYEQSQ